MRTAIVVAFSFLSSLGFTQVVNENARESYSHQKEIYSWESKELTAFKPTFLRGVKTDSGTFSINPLVDLLYGVQNGKETAVNRWGVGLSSNFRYKKWTANFDYLIQNAAYMFYRRAFVAENRVVPGMNVARGKDRVSSEYIAGFINFKANDVFDFEMGYGKNFIGDGYRSLLLSDAANSSPYLKINTKFWKLQYTNLFASHQNIFNVEGERNLYQKKYTATHFLDYKATKWLSIGLFETIVWQAQENDFQRGFDPNYANPVIFYRPVEFSVGSSDNALVGINIKLTPFKRHIIYAQFVFDEFLYSELIADRDQFLNPDEDIQSGWWANKYGAQLGWRTFDFLKIEGLSTLLEFNLVRPYTYAHGAPSQAYSNYNISLAHPLGANFHEMISQVSYQKGRWMAKLQYNQSRKGYSPLGENFGENIEISNASRSREYENTLTQGNAVVTRYLETSLAYEILEGSNTYLTTGFIWREETRPSAKSMNNMVFIQLKTNLFNQYWDY